MSQETERPAGFMGWLKESVTIKLIFIGILILVLLIPSSMVSNLIDERADRQQEVVKEISYNFAGSQLIKGPVLVIPYKTQVKDVDQAGKTIFKDVIQNLYILPDELTIKATLNSELMHRGIFDAVVYKTMVKISGNFTKADLASLGLSADQLMPDKAKITFSISDLKGLKTNPVLNIGNQTLTATPTFNNQALFTDGLQVAVNLTGVNTDSLPFNYTLDLTGSDELSFLQLGKTTDVEVNSNWNSPSFDGRFLPDTRKVTDSNFAAHWRMLYYNRPFPQQWAGDDSLLNNTTKQKNSAFGVKLRLPVDEYQKTTRTSKYSILIILLTFISLFLTELIRKQKIHSFNYILIGAAMVIYYTLLLSFSEQIGFTGAYLVASAATVALITTFIASLLKNKLAALVFACILSVFYTFIFVIIQLEDLALMIGSIALFIIIAVLMYFSRKINWDRH
jgi:inner membrane protein